MNSPIAAVALAVSALVVTGCGDKIAACNDAKLASAKAWRSEADVAASLDDQGRAGACGPAARRAADTAAKSPVEAKQAADAAIAVCKDLMGGGEASGHAWTLCSKVEH